MQAAPNPQMQQAPAAPTAAVSQPTASSNGAQPDYSAQWAEYYRSLGKHKEAEAIEAQMKAKVSSKITSPFSWLSNYKLFCRIK